MCQFSKVILAINNAHSTTEGLWEIYSYETN